MLEFGNGGGPLLVGQEIHLNLHSSLPALCPPANLPLLLPTRSASTLRAIEAPDAIIWPSDCLTFHQSRPHPLPNLVLQLQRSPSASTPLHTTHPSGVLDPRAACRATCPKRTMRSRAGTADRIFAHGPIGGGLGEGGLGWFRLTLVKFEFFARSSTSSSLHEPCPIRQLAGQTPIEPLH